MSMPSSLSLRSFFAALRPRYAGAMVAIACILGAMAFAFSEDTPEGSIKGQVFIADTNKPLDGVTIHLQPAWINGVRDDNDKREYRTTLSGQDGRFSLSHVPAGDYFLSGSSRAHSLTQSAVTVDEGGATSALLPLKRSEADLEIKAHQRVFGSKESAHLSISGYADSGKPAGKDTLQVRIWNTRLSNVLRDTASAGALDKVGASYDPAPTLPKELLHPTHAQAPKEIRAEEVRLKDDREGFFIQKVDFGQLPVGVYLLQMSHEKSARTHEKNFVCAWLLVTDTALIVKRAKTQLVAFAVDMQTGEPLPNSAIRAYRNGRVIAEKPTDSHGIAELTVPTTGGSSDDEDGSSDTARVTTVAVRGEDEAVVVRNDYRNEAGGNFTVHTYTDRPIYRPGQRIQFKSILRRQNGDSLDMQARYKVPAGQQVEVEMRDPSGERLYKQTLTANEYGSIHGAVDLHREAPTGVYLLNLKVNGAEHTHDVVIASYRKPEFTVTVTPDKKRYAQGDTINMTVSGQYYFGAPVAGAKVKYNVYRSPYYAAASDEDSEMYGGEEEGGGFYRRGGDEYYGGTVTQGETRLDENGKAILAFSSADPAHPKMMQAEEYSVHVTIIEGEDRESEADGKALVTPGEFQLAAHPQGYVATPGQPSAFLLSARDYDNKPLPHTQIEIESGYQTWKKNSLQFKRTGLEQVTTGEDGHLYYTITPPRQGEFILKLRAHDAQGHLIVTRTYLYATGDSGGDLETEYPDLALLTDKRNYKAGETARVLINAARTGETVLLTIEGEKVYQMQTVAMPHASTVVYVPVRREFGPNVFLSACYVSKKHYAHSEAPLRVATPQQELKLQITADREKQAAPTSIPDPRRLTSAALAKYAPGDRITYTIQATNADGKPTPCEFSFGVVDESIYAIREDTPGALRDEFYPRRSNEVQTQYSFAIEYLGDADKSEPQVATRKNFPDTAFWEPALRTDSQGKATVSFNLPDNLTTWRATAAAHTLDTRLGRTTEKVIASKDFLVRLETPRFLTQKDQARVVAYIHNETGSSQTASVHLTTDNLSAAGDAVQTLTLSPGQIGQAVWPVTADGFGSAKLTVKAWTVKNSAGTQYTDGLETSLPIRPHGREDIQAFAGELTATNPETEVVRLDSNAIPALSHLTVRITPSITSTLIGATDYLIGFPYGCTEQTMSRFLPDVLVHRAMRLNGIAEVRQAALLPKMVGEGLQRLYRYQHQESGAWGWWEHDSDNPWMTAYVLYGLATAQAEGYPVSQNALAKGRKAAIKMAGDVKTDLSDRAFLLYAIALAGDKNAAREGRHRPLPLDRFSSQALAYMILLDQQLGESDPAVIAEMNKRAVAQDSVLYWKASTAGYHWNWDDEEATAIGLRALLAVNRNDPRIGSVLGWLMRRRTGNYWSSTRDTAWVLAAFCDYLAARSTYLAGGEVRVKLNGNVVQTYLLTPDMQKEKELSLRVPSSSLRSEKNDVTLERVGGDSPIFYSVEMRQTIAMEDIPASTPANAPEKITITREYLRVLPKKSGSDYWTLQTEPTGNQLNQGDRIRVRLTINAPRDMDYVLIEDAYPSGCDISERGDSEDVAEWGYWWSSIDVRDDRIAFFARHLQAGKQIIEYNLRAQTPGSYHVLPTLVQAMYAPDTRAESAETRITVH